MSHSRSTGSDPPSIECACRQGAASSYGMPQDPTDASFRQQHRAGREANDALSRAAHDALENAAVTMVARQQEVEAPLLGEGDDALDLVALPDHRLELDAGQRSLVARLLREHPEVLVDALLGVLDLAHRRGVVGQLLLDGNAVKLGSKTCGESYSDTEGGLGAVRTILREKNLPEHAALLPQYDGAFEGWVPALSGAGSRCRGMNQALAIIVGTTALPMTAATRFEYWGGVMIPWLRPNNADMVPKVSPVDIMSV